MGPSSLPRERGTAAPLSSAHVYCGHGRPSQLVMSCRCAFFGSYFVNKSSLHTLLFCILFTAVWFRDISSFCDSFRYGGFRADSNRASRLRQIYVLSSNARVYDRSVDAVHISLPVNSLQFRPIHLQPRWFSTVVSVHQYCWSMLSLNSLTKYFLCIIQPTVQRQIR